MPQFKLKWSRENPPNEDGTPSEPTTLDTKYVGSTAEKAVANLIRDGHLSEAELSQFTSHSWEELDEDGDVVNRGSVELPGPPPPPPLNQPLPEEDGFDDDEAPGSD